MKLNKILPQKEGWSATIQSCLFIKDHSTAKPVWDGVYKHMKIQFVSINSQKANFLDSLSKRIWLFSKSQYRPNGECFSNDILWLKAWRTELLYAQADILFNFNDEDG